MSGTDRRPGQNDERATKPIVRRVFSRRRAERSRRDGYDARRSAWKGRRGRHRADGTGGATKGRRGRNHREVSMSDTPEKPLTGKKVVVTRARAQADKLARMLEDL